MLVCVRAGNSGPGRALLSLKTGVHAAVAGLE